VLVLTLLVSGCNKPQVTSSPPESPGAEEKAAGDRTHIEDEVAEKSGIRTAPVGPGVIRDEHDAQGLLLTIDGRSAHVMARFPGPVRSLAASVGDHVNEGQTLAVIESNVSLSDYRVISPLSGAVLSRNVAVGDIAGDKPLFEVADLSRLWVDIHLFGADAEHLHAGLPVEVVRLSDDVRASTRIDRVLPGMATASQSTIARAVLNNTDGSWRPGAAVRVRVSVSESSVARAIPLEALQNLRGRDVVFVKEGETYEARVVTVGRRDGHHAEVVDGLKAGEAIVVAQSYLIKADIEKSGVEDAD
jgi:cobalt-zinc-cadmium efflux system membrane fusion protein